VEDTVMTEETLFAELIKDLSPFDRELVFALEELRIRQGTTTIKTSRFALCRLLRLKYNPENVMKVELSLKHLAKTPLYSMDQGHGFAVATKAIAEYYQEGDTEKLVIYLGKLFSFQS
jgi:hypothetical protein